MEFDPRAAARAADVSTRLARSGGAAVIRRVISEMWMANAGRFEKGLGDTARSLGVQCSENLAEKLWDLRDDESMRDAGFVVHRRHGATFLTSDELTIRFVKAPASSGLAPDWSGSFEWESHVRQEAAERNDNAYRAPRHVPGVEPLFAADGLGDADRINEIFIVWNGLLEETPLTAGWVTLPSLRPEHVLAAESMWRDEPQARVDTSDAPVMSDPAAASAPDLNIRLKKDVRAAHGGY